MIILSLIQHHLTAILIGLFCIVMLIPVAILVINHFRLVGVLNGYEIDCKEYDHTGFSTSKL